MLNIAWGNCARGSGALLRPRSPAGAARLRRELHALYRPGGARLGSWSTARLCRGRGGGGGRCSVPGNCTAPAAVPWTAQYGKASTAMARLTHLAHLPSLGGRGVRARRRDTWEERGSRPSFKARVFPGRRAPKGSVGAPAAGSCGSSIPTALGSEALSWSPPARPGFPDELQRSPAMHPRVLQANPTRHSSGALSAKGESHRQGVPTLPQKSSLCGQKSAPRSSHRTKGCTSIPNRRYRSNRCCRGSPPREDLDPASPSRCSPAHCCWIWTLAYSEVVSSGHGAGRRGALLRCTMSRSA